MPDHLFAHDQGPVGPQNELVPAFSHVRDPDGAQCARVAGLTALVGEEDGLVHDHVEAVLGWFAGKDGTFVFKQVAVNKIQALGHRGLPQKYFNKYTTENRGKKVDFSRFFDILHP
jgi:hypothetical protein